MSNNNDRVIRALLRTPWAIEETKLDEILGFVEAHAAGDRLSEEEARERFGVTKSGVPRTYGQIAVLSLYGTIVPRANMMTSFSGGTSCQQFAANFDAALKNDDVTAIVIDVDSPGGSVAGVEELAKKIYDARGTKPIHAVSNYMMASAAYYIASQADQVIASPSSDTGSIGVFMIHTDISEAAAKAGVKHTLIKAGEFKAEGHPYAPLTEEAHAAMQADVDEFYDLFVSAVARGRGVKEAAVRSGFGQGRCLSAKRAKAAGMVDRIATLDEVLEDLRGSKSGARPRGRAEVNLIAASDSPISPEAVMAAAETAALYPGREGATVTFVPRAADETNEDQEPQACPECGAEMEYNDGEWVCPGCGHRGAGETADDEDDKSSRAAGGAAASVITPTPAAQPAPGAKENTVDSQNTTAAPGTSGAATVDVNAAIAAERERGRQIRGMAREHGISDAKATEWIDSGASVEQVQGLVLQELRAGAAASPQIRVGADREAEKPFASLGEQLVAIRQSEGGRADKRLLALNDKFAAASGANTTVPADGGFALQQDFTSGIVSQMWEEGQVLSRVNKVPVSESANGLVRNVLAETSRATGSRYGGVRVYRTEEAGTVEGSRQKLDRQTIILEKLMGLYYATDEILQDAVALTVEAERGFRSELTFVSENEVFRGTGAGQCLGFMNSAALVTVAKETSQTAATVNATNVAKMLARLPARSYKSAVWYFNPAVLPQLVTMTLANQPVFLPGGNLSGAPFGTLFGIPIEPSEYCEALGTVGDIVLADLSQYTAIDKGSPVWQSSIHVRFIYDESAFKLTYRFNGQPDWKSAVTPFKGADTISPFIVLATRS